MDIKKALYEHLDIANDEHWTSDGLPLVEVVSKLVGRAVTRKEITDADPGFSRESANLRKEEADEPEPHDAAGPDADHTGSTDEAPVGEPADVDDPGSPEEKEADEAEPATPSVEPEPAAEPEPEPEPEPPVVLSKEQMASHSLPPRPNDGEMSRLEALRDEVQVRLEEARREETDAKAKVKALNDEVNGLNRRLEHLTKGDPNAGIRGIKAYLARQNELRLERARRRQQFLGGMTEREAVDAIGHTSRLDRALSQRKSQRGSQRPTYPSR